MRVDKGAASSEKYRCLGNMARTRVVLPDCRGPVSVTTGFCSAATQGTIYPDVLESAGAGTGKAHVIKSHHNVGGLNIAEIDGRQQDRQTLWLRGGAGQLSGSR